MNGAFIESVSTIPRLATDPFGWLYYGLAIGLAPEFIIECGVGHGYTTAFLACAAKDLGVPFYAVDNFSLGPEPIDVARNLRRCGVSDAVTLIRDNSTTAIERIGRESRPGSVALVILDTMHTLEMTRAEIAACWPWMGDGSIIGSHDAQHAEFPGVNQALREWQAEAGANAVWFGISGGFAMLQKMEHEPRLLWPDQYMAGERA